MLSKIKFCNTRKIVTYIAAVFIAYGYIYIKHNNHNYNDLFTEQNVKLNLTNLNEFINSFIASDRKNTTYQGLLEMKQVFDSSFSEANFKQKILFQVYYYASLSDKHPNLYSKLNLLEKSLAMLDEQIRENPDNYDFRIARININRNLPLFFKNSKNMQTDVCYLVKGYKQKKVFESIRGNIILEREDFNCLNIEIEQ